MEDFKTIFNYIIVAFFYGLWLVFFHYCLKPFLDPIIDQHTWVLFIVFPLRWLGGLLFAIWIIDLIRDKLDQI
jgi:hypothetical protein